MTKNELALFKQQQELTRQTQTQLDKAMEALEEALTENERLKELIKRHKKDVAMSKPRTIIKFNKKLFQNITEILNTESAEVHGKAILELYNAGHDKIVYRSFNTLREAKTAVQYKLSRVMIAYVDDKISDENRE